MTGSRDLLLELQRLQQRLSVAAQRELLGNKAVEQLPRRPGIRAQQERAPTLNALAEPLHQLNAAVGHLHPLKSKLLEQLIALLHRVARLYSTR